MPSDADLLDFESRYPHWTGQQELDIRNHFGLAPARYFQLLLRAASSLEGQAHDPITARRVRARVRNAA